MRASEGGYLDIVKELLKAQADVDMEDEVCRLCQELRITTVLYIWDIVRSSLSAEMVFSECVHSG